MVVFVSNFIPNLAALLLFTGGIFSTQNSIKMDI